LNIEVANTIFLEKSSWKLLYISSCAIYESRKKFCFFL